MGLEYIIFLLWRGYWLYFFPISFGLLLAICNSSSMYTTHHRIFNLNISVPCEYETSWSDCYIFISLTINRSRMKINLFYSSRTNWWKSNRFLSLFYVIACLAMHKSSNFFSFTIVFKHCRTILISFLIL